jgi:hypothetical protein
MQNDIGNIIFTTISCKIPQLPDTIFQLQYTEYRYLYIYITLYVLFSLFVFVSAAGHYFRIWTGQVSALF